MYPLEKYKYYVGKNEVIAVSTFAGRAYRGIAKCHPGDNFDVEYGKRLAGLRCGLKIAKKREKIAEAKMKAMAEIYAEIENELDFLSSYSENARNEVKEIENYLEGIEINDRD